MNPRFEKEQTARVLTLVTLVQGGQKLSFLTNEVLYQTRK